VQAICARRRAGQEPGQLTGWRCRGGESGGRADRQGYHDAGAEPAQDANGTVDAIHNDLLEAEFPWSGGAAHRPGSGEHEDGRRGQGVQPGCGPAVGGNWLIIVPRLRVCRRSGLAWRAGAGRCH